MIEPMNNPWGGRPPFNWAHQGGACEGPSNTLYAMRRALACGADGLELDVHRTSDGALVVCHDKELDRTTSGRGLIAKQTLALVQASDSAYWWVPGKVDDHANTDHALFVHRGRGPADHDFRVPTLGEVMAAFPDTPLNLELKDSGYEAQLARELREAERKAVIVISFKERRLREFRKAAPSIDTAAGPWFLLSFWILSRVWLARKPPCGVVALEVPHRLAGFTICDRRLLRAAHRHGLVVYAWTVNDEKQMARLLHIGVDGIMTDRPGLLARLTGQDGCGICEPSEPPPPTPAPPSDVAELRIHGVGGSPGPRLLGFDDPRDAPICPQRSRGAITIRARCGPEGRVVGFDWGDLTSGSWGQAIWVFLLPFTLLNVAGWAHTSSGARLASLWRWLTRRLVIVAGLLLTASWVLWIADLLIAYIAYQWVPRAFGTEKRRLPDRGWGVTLSETGVRYLALGGGTVLVLALLVVAAIVAGRVSKQAGEPGTEAFCRDDGPFSDAFFERGPSGLASQKAHLCVGVLMLAVVTMQAARSVVSGDRTAKHPFDLTIVRIAGLNLVVLSLLVLCSWLLPWLFSLGRRPAPGVRRPNGTAAGAAVLATALTNAFFSGAVLWLVRYLGGHPRSKEALVTGRDLVLLDAYFVVAVSWVLIGITLCCLQKRMSRTLRTCGSSEEIHEPWRRRAAGAQATARIIHKIDVVLVSLATTFVLVGVIFGLMRVDRTGWVWDWEVKVPVTTGFAYTAAAWALPWAAAFAVLRIRAAASDNRLRRFFGQAWDVLSFWPRHHHPFAVRPYSHIAVPALRDEIVRLTNGDARLVIAAHSQGSVLAIAALATISPSARSRIALVTYGSHISGLYRRGFPDHFDPTVIGEITRTFGGGRVPLWHNFYRLTDPIGGPMFDDAPDGARGYDHCLPDPAIDPARSGRMDSAPPREHDRDPFVALAVHSNYLNERRLKEIITSVKEDLARAGTPGTGRRKL